MPIEPGQELLHYHIEEKIGEGGMGVVWRARDTNLDRLVAIKVIPEGISREGDRLARFEREAKLLASLSHPGIATIYGLHEAQGTRFIAMEYVPGEDLAQRLARGPLPLEDALGAAQKIAEALEAAHEQGVVHRDLKPANVKLANDGTVKVLDFGLAKVLGVDSTAGPTASPAYSPTVTSARTLAGMILGTAAYMSPEQAKGKPVDRRADIWSFGALVTEMLVGKRLFDAETISETLAQVLMAPVDLAQLPSTTPVPVHRLLERCLERDPSRRLRDIGEARIVLADVNSGKSAPQDPRAIPAAPSMPATGRSRAAALAPWAVAVLAAVVAALAWTAGSRGTEPPRPRIVTAILPPDGAAFNARRGMALSPDGSWLAFTARKADEPPKLWLRNLAEATARVVDGTDGANSPFWSPDGAQVAFFADGRLKKVVVASGLIDTLSDEAYPSGGIWTADGHVLISRGWGRGLYRIPVAGGNAEMIVGTGAAESNSPAWPWLLPDGKHFLYLLRLYASEQRSGELRLASLDGSMDKLLMSSNSNAIYAEPGYLLWWQDGNVRAQRFDLERLELVGDAESLIPGVGFNPAFGYMTLTASRNGMLLYQQGELEADDELALVDRGGKLLRVVGRPGSYYGPRLSHDGRQIALDISDETNRGDIWVLDVARGSGTRLTFFSEDDTRARWSPDSRRIVFTSGRGSERFGLWVCDNRPGAEAEMLVEDAEGDLNPLGWTAEGHVLLQRQTRHDQDLYVYSLADRELRPWVATEFTEQAGSVSPDGRFAAYTSDETGRREVWLQTFPSPGARWRVSVDGGDWPAWRKDGKELYYVDLTGQLVAVALGWRQEGGGSDPEFGPPQALFRADFKTHTDRQYDTLDGETFLLNRMRVSEAREPLTLVQNWK